VEGRYRGADDFRALHIDPSDALASWRAAVSPDAPWPDQLRHDFAALNLGEELGLDNAERLLATIAVAVEIEPRLRPLVSALADDPATRSPTVAVAAELAGAIGVPPYAVRAACGPDGRLAVYELVRVVPVDGRPSLLDAQLVASEWLVSHAAGSATAPTGLRWTVGAADAEVGWPLAVRGADHVLHAERLALRAAVNTCNDPAALGRSARDARVVGAVLVVGSTERPADDIVSRCELLARLGSRIAVSTEPPVRWVPPPHWHILDVTPLCAADRAERWSRGLAASSITADSCAIAAVARDYALGAGPIDDALVRTVISGNPRVAARSTAWQDLTSVARQADTSVSWGDLVVPDGVRATLREITAAIAGRRIVLDDWTFGASPGGRGYHVLFAGPSGTGKTLAASVIAAEVGLELWIVDLARIVDKYLGETEKLLDQVLRSAQTSGAMLLFDEAEALFGRRGEVREGRDRWANIEIAYMLQRIEQHDGVTVLTTNISQHIDEAFARRMSQRVDFPIPDKPLRRKLWQRCVPATAPMSDRADLDIAGDRFELAGGAIRNAALNAAYAAAADDGIITLRHIVRASIGEMIKAGRAPTRADLGDLAGLVGN
jgi:hypothetical protein